MPCAERWTALHKAFWYIVSDVRNLVHYFYLNSVSYLGVSGGAFTSLSRFIRSMAVGLVPKCRVLQIVESADGQITF